jgi:hypothetical protein
VSTSDVVGWRSRLQSWESTTLLQSPDCIIQLTFRPSPHKLSPYLGIQTRRQAPTARMPWSSSIRAEQIVAGRYGSLRNRLFSGFTCLQASHPQQVGLVRLEKPTGVAVTPLLGGRHRQRSLSLSARQLHAISSAHTELRIDGSA